MSERALEFVETWVSQHVTAETDPAQAKALARQCQEAASHEGISMSEIDDTFDDLAAFMAGEIAEARER
jgi:hypothetical protein